MFSNIGGKIKVAAIVLCWIGILVSIIAGIKLLDEAYHDDEFVIGWMVLIGAPIISWISSLFVYGFGELIEKTCDIVELMKTNAFFQRQASKADKIRMLNEWRTEGLITEEELDAKLEELKHE